MIDALAKQQFADAQRDPAFKLGPKTCAWIADKIKPAHEGSVKVAAADRNAERARVMAMAEDARPIPDAMDVSKREVANG